MWMKSAEKNISREKEIGRGNIITVVSRWGIYVLDPQEVDDEFVFDCLGNKFYVTIPDLAYISWLEEKIEELQKTTKKV